MNKEYLEAFENIMKIYGDTNSLEGTYNDFLTIKKAILELKAIKESNPSEALECLEKIKNHLFERFKNEECSEDFIEGYKKILFEPIKQALLKAQEDKKKVLEQEKEINALKSDLEEQSELAKYYLEEQEKVLEIIKEKRVNVNQLLLCWKVEMYNSRCRKGFELSKDEFDLLKRWLGND